MTALGICGYGADHVLAHAPEVVAEEADALTLGALEGRKVAVEQPLWLALVVTAFPALAHVPADRGEVGAPRS